MIDVLSSTIENKITVTISSTTDIDCLVLAYHVQNILQAYGVDNRLQIVSIYSMIFVWQTKREKKVMCVYGKMTVY